MSNQSDIFKELLELLTNRMIGGIDIFNFDNEVNGNKIVI